MRSSILKWIINTVYENLDHYFLCYSFVCWKVLKSLIHSMSQGCLWEPKPVPDSGIRSLNVLVVFSRRHVTMSVLPGILLNQTSMIDDTRLAPLLAMLMKLLKGLLVYVPFREILIDASFSRGISTARYFISRPKHWLWNVVFTYQCGEILPVCVRSEKLSSSN